MVMFTLRYFGTNAKAAPKIKVTIGLYPLRINYVEKFQRRTTGLLRANFPFLKLPHRLLVEHANAVESAGSLVHFSKDSAFLHRQSPSMTVTEPDLDESRGLRLRRTLARRCCRSSLGRQHGRRA